MNAPNRIAKVAGKRIGAGSVRLQCPTGGAGAPNAPNTFDTLMERLERAAERGPQWIECDVCEGRGWIVLPGPVAQPECDECGGRGGYFTDPSLALKRMRALEQRTLTGWEYAESKALGMEGS